MFSFLKGGLLSPFRIGVVAVVGAGLAFAAFVGVKAPPPEPAPAAEPEHLAEGGNIDESALRYYASSGQTARRDAEIQRLRRLYPDWRPPEDVFEPPANTGADESELWELFAADKLGELRAAIDQRKTTEPGWKPSADLTSKLRAKIFHDKVLSLAKDEKYAEIIELAEAERDPGGRPDVDLLWTIAEAYAKAQRPDDALAIYKSILATNTNQQERLATVQKAMAFLPMDNVEQLLNMAKKDASGKSEFEPLRLDIAGARIAAFLHDERKQVVAADDLAVFGAKAAKAQDANQPALLGWYYLKVEDFQKALQWFKVSIEHGGDAVVAHGMAHALDSLGMRREAEEVAFAWRKPFINNMLLFLDLLEVDLTNPTPPPIEPERLERYGEVTLAIASGEGAQALGWYAYNSCQFDVARQWFERAVAWFPKDQTVYGLGLSYQRLKMKKEMMDLVNRYDGLFPHVIGLIFPDDLYHPPMPCEQKGFNQANASAQQYTTNRNYADGAYAKDFSDHYGRTPNAAAPVAAGNASSRFMTQDAPVAYNPTYNQGLQRRTENVRVPAPDDPYRSNDPDRAQRPPVIDRAQFPIKVNPENPYRFAPVGQPAVVNASVGSIAAATPGGFAREPVVGAFPLVARRVPGVGPMPYERYGFALLPGYNGINSPSSPTASEQVAPAGTTWALEARKTGSNGQAVKSRQNAPVRTAPQTTLPARSG